MNTRKNVQKALFSKVETESKKVELAAAQFESKAKSIEKEYRNAIGEMESLAIDLELKESRVKSLITEYRANLDNYRKDVSNGLKEYGIDKIPADWERQFSRLQDRVKDIKSIKGIATQVKTNFR